MNNKEKLKLNIIKACINGTITVQSAAIRLNISTRQVKRLKRRIRELGSNSILHGNCGRSPVNSLSPDLIQSILSIKSNPDLNDVNFSHFRDILADDFNIHVSYSFLYSTLKKHGIKSPRKHRKPRKYNRRKRKPKEGILLQADGTPHRFFKGDNNSYSIHGFIDDATGKITGLYMAKNECLQGYLEVARQTFLNFGVPESIYSDGLSVFFTSSSSKTSVYDDLDGLDKPLTQFGKIADLLGINLIRASSPQAKGRIERLWNTLHDRLFTEFARNKINTIQDANYFLASYINKYNKRFAVSPEDSVSSFIPLRKDLNLDTLLSAKYERTIDRGSCFSIKNMIFNVPSRDILPGKRVTVLISNRIGVKVLYKDRVYDTVPVIDKNKRTITSSDSAENTIAKVVYFYCFKNEKDNNPIGTI